MGLFSGNFSSWQLGRPGMNADMRRTNLDPADAQYVAPRTTSSGLPAAFGERMGEVGERFSSSSNPLLQGVGGIFSRLGNKGAPADPNAMPNTMPGANGYQRFDDPQKKQLLQAMLTRARGGTPGGAPTNPLPAPGGNVPA